MRTQGTEELEFTPPKGARRTLIPNDDPTIIIAYAVATAQGACPHRSQKRLTAALTLCRVCSKVLESEEG